MNQKWKIIMSEETQKDFVLDNEGYYKVNLDFLKQTFDDWLDKNLKEEPEPEFHLKREDTKLYLKITQDGSEDLMDDGTEYYLVYESLKDEDELKKEIENEKQYNKEHGVLVRETFDFTEEEDE
jgi:hypothetical protein